MAEALTGAAGSQTDVRLERQTEYVVFLLSLPGWVLLAKLYKLYDQDDARADHSTLDEIAPILHMTTVGAWLFFATSWLTNLVSPQFTKLALFWLLATAFLVFTRTGARAAWRRHHVSEQNTVIVGAGDVGHLVARKFKLHPELGIKVVGFVDDAPKLVDRGLGIGLLGPRDRLPEIVEKHDVERVIVAFSKDSHAESLRLIRSLRDLDVRVDIVPRLFEALGPSVTVHGVGGLPLVSLPMLYLSRSDRLLKRGMDVVLASIGLVLLAPVLMAIAAGIKLTSSGPVFFRQVRMGANDRPFRIFKFRSMIADADRLKRDLVQLNKNISADARMFKIPDDPRMTAFGRFLRRYSLDELPQLLNVLVGDMTLVGPRPLILDEDCHVDDWARRRLDLKPGITGPWQVLGRNEIPFDEMVKLDYLYVTNWSLWRDVKLLLQTVAVVLRTRPVVY